MSSNLAVDFGSSNTRLATWDTATDSPRLIAPPHISEMASQVGDTGNMEKVPFVPSLIHYSMDRTWVGRQVRERGLEHSPAVFRWMKRFISNRLDTPRRVGDRLITMPQAGADFLKTTLLAALQEVNLDDGEVVFTVPVESFENYTDWLIQILDQTGLPRHRFIDEASAAALGYAISMKGNDLVLVFDFGGGTLDVSMVRIEDKSSLRDRVTVIGKSGAEIGGSNLDQWLYEDILERNQLKPEDIEKMSGLLLMELERAKQNLTFDEKSDVIVTDPSTGEVISHRYTRSQFEEILDKNSLFETINSVIERSLGFARERGYCKDDLSAVIMIGGSSLIPSVRRSVKQIFGELAHGHRPLDAVVRGAAKFSVGVDFFDHIQHDYAIKFYNRSIGAHDFKLVVPSGTAYPSQGPICKIMVSASYDDQEYLGLELYEVGYNGARKGRDAKLDLVFDPQGSARFIERNETEISARLWINENSPTFIHAAPKAKQGVKRFPVELSIDAVKRLCVTVRDLQTNKVLLKEHPVIKLT